MNTPSKLHCLISVVLLSGLITLTSITHATPSSNTPHPYTLQQCLGLPDAQRLLCYDQVATQQPMEPTSASAPNHMASQNSWDLSIQNTDTSPTPTNTDPVAQNDVPLPSSPSMLENMWELTESTQRSMFSLVSYAPNYMLPVQYSDRVNRAPSSPSPGRTASTREYNRVEAKFQLSIRTKIGRDLFRPNDSLWFGYTQVSQWQIWTPELSRPFRATSYKPEILYIVPIQYKLPDSPWTLRMAGLGLIHESNGQDNPLSRSWNRVYLSLGLDRDNMSVYTRFWARIPDSDDDNPDIIDHIGRADITLNWAIRPGNNLSFTFASNLRNSNKGSIQANYFFPLSSLWGMGNNLRGYIQVFHGYGETITDYNFRRTAIGIGVALKEW